MSDLYEGDSITMSVTHSVTINGDNSWIRLEINSKVQPNESGDQAFDRVNQVIQDKIMTAIENSAQTVIDYDKDKS